MTTSPSSSDQHRPVLVCVSVSHQNTAKIASAMADVLHADVVAPDDLDPSRLGTAELVGFGSGIFYQNFHPRLREFVASLPVRHGRRAFLFSTSSGLPEPPWSRYTRHLADELRGKGFEIAGTFTCRGYDTWLPFKVVGGHHRGRPATADLDAARAFARRLRRSDAEAAVE